MQKTAFFARCPFELKDVVKIILDKDKNILSDETYTVMDIITIHSLKTSEVKFKLIVSDSFGKDLAERDINDFKLISYGKQE